MKLFPRVLKFNYINCIKGKCMLIGDVYVGLGESNRQR